jgi:hypothetical protein
MRRGPNPKEASVAGVVTAEAAVDAEEAAAAAGTSKVKIFLEGAAKSRGGELRASSLQLPAASQSTKTGVLLELVSWKLVAGNW